MVKATYRIPGKETYSYLEIQDDVESVEEAIEGFKHAISVYNGSGEGLDTKEWNRVVCEYLTTGNVVNGTELYQAMSPLQQDFLQTLKRAFKRIKNKNNETEN